MVKADVSLDLERRIGRVLVVEDDPGERARLISFLRKFGLYEISQAQNGREGLNYLGQGKYRVVFSDCSMPEIDGLQMLESMRERGDYTPVVYVTSTNPDDVVPFADMFGPYDLVSKIHMEQDLPKVIGKYLH